MRYKAIVSYDGSRYGGWQKQVNTTSIQSEIEMALSKMQKVPIVITASGRTDARVHAVAQVFHFNSTSHIKSDGWVLGLNAILPKDIRIQEVTLVDDAFHARFSAVSKRYDYLITTDVRNPFFEHYMGKDRTLLDVAYMSECAAIFLGTHDFTSFTSNKIDYRKERTKTLFRLDVIQEEHYVRMIFEGTGFLRYMVRMIAQTLIEAGKHRLTKEEMQWMLDGKNKHLCRYKATPEGLYLISVNY